MAKTMQQVAKEEAQENHWNEESLSPVLHSFRSKHDKITKQKSEAGTELAREFKTLKKNGINIDALKQVLKIDKMDGETRQAYFQNLCAQLRALGTFDQGDLFDSLYGSEDAFYRREQISNDTAVAAAQRAFASEHGRRSGREAKDLDECPYQTKGGELFDLWHKSYDEGQAENAKPMAAAE